MRRALLLVGLGLVAGAVLHAPLRAQVRDTIPKRPDTTAKRDTIPKRVDSTAKRTDSTFAIPIPLGADSLLRDSLAKRDSLKKPVVKKDTVKAALAHAELPLDIGIAHRFHWSGDSLAATGAITVADLLERVPGLTTLRAGWIAAPQNAAYLGDVHRVRVFYDGLSMDPLDPRGGGALDLSQINLWGVEDAVIEQGPEEVRVYLRSWRVQNTTAVTRTDVGTGDQQTNLYRGFYGRRFDNNLALQFGAQEFGTTPPSEFGTSNDQLGIFARVGWARKDWSVDAHITRTSRHRGSILGDELGDSIPQVESARSDAYLRIGFRDPDTSAVWWQAMAVASSYNYTGIRTKTIATPLTAQDSAFNVTSLDTSTAQSQYIITAGTTRGPLRLSGTERLYTRFGKEIAAPSVRASYEVNRLSVSAYAEGKSIDSVSRSDVTAQFAPLSFIKLIGSAGRVSDDGIKDSSFSASYLRAEAGLRFRKLWLLGGIVQRDSVRLAAPKVFDTTFVAAREGKAHGVTAAIRGQIYKLLQADVSAVRWSDSTGLYRPQYETRSELFARTNLLSRFPSGDLGLFGSIVHEYRSNVRFPTADGSYVTAGGYRTLSTLVEIRILSATISWQFRNFLGARYSQVPTFVMPRQTNFYGVRWQFFN